MATEGVIPATQQYQHDHLLNEIESSDGPLGPMLRTVYDGNQHTGFMEKLDSRIRAHDKDIERMCNYHYQGFIESVNELLKVRADARKLKIRVQEANEALQNSGCELSLKCEELIKCRIVQKNIASVIETLSVCLPVLEMYSKLKDQMSERRYYPALKTLEQLENNYLPQIKSFRFGEIMKNNIPILRESIKDASMSDLRDFLEDIRVHSVKLGEIAMKRAHRHNDLSLSHGLSVENDEEEYDKSAQELVDFSPVYRCLHIYTALGQRESFESYYRKQRRKQARLALQPNHGTIEESLDAYRAYFHQIVGFFVVEDTVLHTTEGLVTRGTVDELWDMAVAKIGPVLRTQSKYCSEKSLLLQVKELMVWFSHTLSGYGFTVIKIYEVLSEMREQYNELLMKEWDLKFKAILDEDNYTPIYCETKDEYAYVMQELPYDDSATKDESFPKRFPFSGCVPKIYNEVMKFITACLRFNENLNVSQTEVGDSVRKSTNLLITRTLGGCLMSIVKEKEERDKISIAQLVQISINTMHLETACQSLEEFVSSVTGTSNDGINVARVYGLAVFKDIRAESEQQVYDKLNSKVDEFLDLASYNWVPSGDRIHASGYLVDLLAYLQSTLLTFTTLPGNVAQTACMSTCKHIAQNLRAFLLDEEVKQINYHGLQAFNQDIRKCEEFVNSNPVEGFEDGVLQMTFQELRQLLDLLMASDWSTYLAEHGSIQSKYDRVSPQIVAKLLEKMMESDKKKSVLISLKKSDRDKKKLMETIVKKLRALNGESHETT